MAENDQDVAVVEEVDASQGSSDPNQATPAKEADIESGQGPKKPSQEPAPPGESGKPPKEGPVPYARFKEAQEERTQFKSLLEEFAKHGLETPEHAEVLRSEVDRLGTQIGSYEDACSKGQIFNLVAEHYPQIYQDHCVSILSQLLEAFSSSFRKRNDDEGRVLSEAADTMLEMTRRNAQQSPRRTAREDPERESLASERQEYFDERIQTEVDSRLAAKINALPIVQELQFKDDAQRQFFTDQILEQLGATLDNDEVFARENKRLQDPKRGFGRDQQKDVAELHVRYGTMAGRLERAVAHTITLLNLARKSPHAAGKGPNGQGTERREVGAEGAAATGGSVPIDAKQRIREELMQGGLRGSALMKEFMARVRKMATG